MLYPIFLKVDLFLYLECIAEDNSLEIYIDNLIFSNSMMHNRLFTLYITIHFTHNKVVP